jgi:hypothetical protein
MDDIKGDSIDQKDLLSIENFQVFKENKVLDDQSSYFDEFNENQLHISV